MRRQITVGFDNEINVHEVAEIFKKFFGETLVGQGVLENGLPQGCLYISNPKKRPHVFRRLGDRHVRSDLGFLVN